MAQVTRTHPDEMSPPIGAPALPAPTLVGTARKRTKRQAEAASVITADARCTPVLVRAAIVGRARMPRAALEITTPGNEVIGNVALVNTSAAFDPRERFWLVGDPTPGSAVALVSEGATQVILPGSRLRAGPVTEPEWSPLACRMLGWQRTATSADLPEAWRHLAAAEGAGPSDPAFLRAVDRFRTAAVLVPILFFAVCFPFLFVIRPLAEAGATRAILLVLPVLGGGFMTVWSAICRRRLIKEAERVEAGSSRWGKQIAFTQSYWSGMRKPAVVWDGPIPATVLA